MKNKKHLLAALAFVGLSAGCSDYLDVNTNPNAPTSVAANLYLPQIEHFMATSPQFDGRYVGRYTQEWTLPGTSLGTWDRMGYDPGSDNGGEQWRMFYWLHGQNLIDMTTKAEAEKRWDVLGVGLVIKAWDWQVLTDLHGDVIYREAFDQTRTSFDYDSQDTVYAAIHKLLDSAIVVLNKTGDAVDATYLARGDHIYNGDRTKWLKFAHGLLAIHLNHFSNKPSYAPAQVISEVDKSFTGNADDAIFAYPAVSPTVSDDRNFLGPSRGNINSYRQTTFIVNLMNGTQFGGVADPRMSRMLAPDSLGQFIGLDINTVGFGALTNAQRPFNFFGYFGTAGAGLPSRYLFADKTKIPIMTYSQLQFVKAEAALRAGDQATAKAAYTNAISSHIDFVNARNTDDGQTPPQITASEKSAFLASTAIVPATLTLSHILSQKFIAQWAWGHNELWMDMRRYHYTDVDPVSGTQVFRGWSPATNLYPDNAGKLVQRIRPRYNSDYVWNQLGLSNIKPISGLAPDYHTSPLWITLP